VTVVEFCRLPSASEN